MRPAIEAGLIQSAEAAETYMRQLLGMPGASESSLGSVW